MTSDFRRTSSVDQDIPEASDADRSAIDEPEVTSAVIHLFQRVREFVDIPNGRSMTSVLVVDLTLRRIGADKFLIWVPSGQPTITAGTTLQRIATLGSPNEGGAYVEYRVLDGPRAGEVVNVALFGRWRFHESIASLLAAFADEPLLADEAFLTEVRTLLGSVQAKSEGTSQPTDSGL